MPGRIEKHPVLGQLPQRARIRFQYDGAAIEGLEGETVAAALLANGIRTLRYHEASGQPRGIYCNIGHCMECRVTVNGRDGMRACLTVIEEGMNICPGQVLPAPFRKEGERR